MGRRIRWLGLIMIVCLAAVIVQLVNIQLVRGPALRESAANPRNASKVYDNQRGNIYASDGTLLAQSVRSSSASPFLYLRKYPQGSLYSQVVGYASKYYGTAGIENQYNQQLTLHTLPAQTLSQALGFEPLQSSIDNVTLTIDPHLQETAESALSQITGANKDAAVMAVDPSTGAVLADYSTPTFDPNVLASPDVTAERDAGYADFNQKDAEGNYPGVPLATGETFPPGSTFKVVTTTAVYNLDPALSNFTFPSASSTPLPNSNQLLHNDGGEVCGGDIAADAAAVVRPRLRAARDRPGRRHPVQAGRALRLQLDAPHRPAQGVGGHAELPFALEHLAAQSGDPGLLGHRPGERAGQRAVECPGGGGIANHGVIMNPYLVQQITNSDGAVVSTHQPTPWMTASSPQAAAQVTSLMQLVVTKGTADGVGFSPALDAAVKTGTAQTGNPQANTDDWMIGFAPANDPKIAVAVVVPYQNFVDTGAGIAGPIMKAMLDAAVLPNGD